MTDEDAVNKALICSALRNNGRNAAFI